MSHLQEVLIELNPKQLLIIYVLFAVLRVGVKKKKKKKKLEHLQVVVPQICDKDIQTSLINSVTPMQVDQQYPSKS